MGRPAVRPGPCQWSNNSGLSGVFWSPQLWRLRINVTRIKTFALASAIAVSLATGVAALTPATAVAAEQSANKITTKAVAVPMKKAQEAIQAKQWDTALAEIKKAQAVE